MSALSFRINRSPLPQNLVNCNVRDQHTLNQTDQEFTQWLANIPNRSMQDLNNEAKNMDLFSKPQLRYRPITDNNATKKLLHKVFNSAWENSNPSLDDTVAINQHLNPDKFLFYITLQKILLIKCPKIIGMGINILKYPVSIYIYFQYFGILKNSSYAISNLIAAKGVPFLINNCPLEIIRVGNVVAKTLSGFERAPLNSLCFSLSTYHLAKHLNIRYISTVAKIISSIILSRVIYSTFPGYLTYAINSGFSINSFDLSLSSINFFSRISEQFTMIGMKNENHMRNELKNHLRTVWINAMISQIPQNQPLNIIEPALQ